MLHVQLLSGTLWLAGIVTAVIEQDSFADDLKLCVYHEDLNLEE